MLKKLLKYEFQATGRIFLPLYGALIVVAFIQRLFLAFNLNSLDSLALNILTAMVPTIFGALIMAICVVTFIMMMQRFYKNLLGREGYLMFTLPVSVSKLIWSKLIVIVVWSILSVLIGILSFFIVFLQAVDFTLIMSEFGELLKQLHINHFMLSAVETVVLILAVGISEVLSIYLSMAIGQLSNKHKVLSAVGAYIGISILVNNVVMAVVISAGNSPLGDTLFRTLFSGLNEVQTVNVGLMIIILFFVIQAVVYFLITKHLLTKKLNLE